MSRRPTRAELAQECLGDILSRVSEMGWDVFNTASFLRRMAHECFRAADALEGRRPDKGRE